MKRFSLVQLQTSVGTPVLVVFNARLKRHYPMIVRYLSYIFLSRLSMVHIDKRSVGRPVSRSVGHGQVWSAARNVLLIFLASTILSRFPASSLLSKIQVLVLNGDYIFAWIGFGQDDFAGPGHIAFPSLAIVWRGFREQSSGSNLNALAISGICQPFGDGVDSSNYTFGVHRIATPLSPMFVQESFQSNTWNQCLHNATLAEREAPAFIPCYIPGKGSCTAEWSWHWMHHVERHKMHHTCIAYKLFEFLSLTFIRQALL